MKIIRLLPLMMVLLINAKAFAREFYQVNLHLDLSYTNINDGTREVINNFPVVLRSSDDKRFCQVHVAQTIIPCTTEFFDLAYRIPNIVSYLTRNNWIELFKVLEGAGLLSSGDNAKMTRILNSCERCNLRISSYENLLYQLHDDEPEAFHLTLKDFTSPMKL